MSDARRLPAAKSSRAAAVRIAGLCPTARFSSAKRGMPICRQTLRRADPCPAMSSVRMEISSYCRPLSRTSVRISEAIVSAWVNGLEQRTRRMCSGSPPKRSGGRLYRFFSRCLNSDGRLLGNAPRADRIFASSPSSRAICSRAEAALPGAANRDASGSALLPIVSVTFRPRLFFSNARMKSSSRRVNE